jgi:hypothetical protein
LGSKSTSSLEVISCVGCVDSVKQARKLCLGVSPFIRLYNIWCFAKLAFIARCFEIDKEVERAEQRGFQLLHAGPRNSPNCAVRFSLKSLGSKFQVLSLKVRSRAIMFRAFTCASNILSNHLVRLNLLCTMMISLLLTRWCVTGCKRVLIFKVESEIE